MKDGLISVIVPLPPSTPFPELLRDSLDQQRYKPIEVIEVAGSNVQENRNKGAARAQGEFLFFCDADVTLHPDCLKKLRAGLISDRLASYAYCDYSRTGHFSGRLISQPFEKERLVSYNYISTMSLVRAKDFPGFNPSVKRLQDWDLWLTMLEQNKHGIYVPGVFFNAFFSRRGISARGKDDAALAVAKIHELHPRLYAH